MTKSNAMGKKPHTGYSDKVHSGEAQPAWLHTHSHDPNPGPPSDDPRFVLVLPDGAEQRLGPEQLAELPQSVVHDCFIVSTGHGTSGPFVFGGVALADLMTAYVAPGPQGLPAWSYVDVISADGFGNRVQRSELTADLDVENDAAANTFLLAIEIDGRPMERQEGLVRLIVPSETDDALRQVKWISRIEIHR